MKKFNSKSQQGAVLAFCLVMLLLLTLAGTRMIQQNKQQLEMANSSRLLTQEFANAEGGLKEAENVLELHDVHVDPTVTPDDDKYRENHQCTPIPDIFKQQILISGTVLVNKTLENGTVLKAEIIESSCADKTGTLVQKCTSYDYKTGVVTCFPADKGEDGEICTGDTIKDVAGLFYSADNACYQHYNPEVIDGIALSPKPPKCPIYTYKIRTISTSLNGTQRELIRGKQIRCGTP